MWMYVNLINDDDIKRYIKSLFMNIMAELRD